VPGVLPAQCPHADARKAHIAQGYSRCSFHESFHGIGTGPAGSVTVSDGRCQEERAPTRLFDSWDFIGSRGRQDYRVDLPDGTSVAVEAKGCPDGNNTNIWDRPQWADEFVVWSLCPRVSLTTPAAASGLASLYASCQK
jgi:hypothetical protein